MAWNWGHTYSIGELKEILGLKDPRGKEPEQYTKVSQLKEKVLIWLKGK